MIQIRILGNDGTAALEKVHPDVFDDPIDKESAERFLRDPYHHIAVATKDGTVIGFASAVHMGHPDKTHPELFINEIGVASEYQRQGIGTELLNELFGIGRKHGCRMAWVLTDRRNYAAMELYKVCGGQRPTDHVMIEFQLHEEV